ncbi:MAG: Lipase-like protein [Myxococcales bacterium]|nr:Lipase-like protein [Myxococcales bacterium]
MQTMSRLVLVAVLLAGCEPEVKTPNTTPVVVALFDPLGSPPVVPTPNDLAFTGGDGVHLNVPDAPDASPAQKAFNAYLRTLAGFPSSSTATASFSKPLDASRVTLSSATTGAGSLVVVDTTAVAPLGPDQLTAALSADGQTVNLTPAQRWTSGHRYAALVFGGADPAGLRGAGGETVLASPAFFFLRSPNPLIARCPDTANPDCACPPEAIADPTDTTCHSVVMGLPDATARVVEPQRRLLQTALGTLLPLVAPGRNQSDLVLFWTFTITAQPMTVFDPTRGDVPFPNDVLIDPVTGRVNLPIAAGDPQAAVKMALNTLDGFSVSAPETLGIDATTGLDAKTLVPGRSVFLLNLDPRPTAEQPVYSVVSAGGQLVLTPEMPLESDQDKYAVLVTTAVADANGQPLVPSPTMVLATGENPLFDGTHSTVSVLGDAEAMQLETLRLALQPLIVKITAMGLPRTSLAALWTFTTQSIARPLGALDLFPAGAMLPSDVTIDKVATAADIAASPLATLLPDVGYVVIGSFTSRYVFDPTTKLVSFDRSGMTFTVHPPAAAATTTIRFWLALPKLPATGAVPVAIMQHGLTSWRGDVLPLAEGAAKNGGWASVGFDIDFHGSRSKCIADNQCASGTCDKATGACPGGFLLTTSAMNPLACDLAALSGDTMNDCKPAISGQNYVDASNLFSGRANGYQYVVDTSQLIRVLSDTTNPNGLAAKLAAATVPVTPTIDVTKIGFLGQSLGAIDGAVFLAADARPKVGVLNVGGGHVFEIISDGAFHSLVDQYLMSIGVMRGTPAYAQIVATARWVLDPTDPFSVAPFLRSRPIINQEAGMDTVIPPVYEEALAQAIWGPMGLDAMHHARGALADRTTFFSVYYPAATHSSLLTGTPAPDATNMQADAFGYLLSFGAVK